MNPSEVIELLQIYVGNARPRTTLLLEEELVEIVGGAGGSLVVTARGRVFCEAIRCLPLPVREERWVMPDDSHAE